VTPRPYTLIAELTYRCPLRCPYCSNPTDYAEHRGELSTEEWARAFQEAEALGVVQLHLTGGEPLARRDLEDLIRRARELDLYTNMITSGIPLTRERVGALRRAGLDAVQLSFQDADAESADRIAGRRSHEAKLAAARWVRDEGLALTINIVLHRANIDRVEAMIAMAEALGAERLELANTQYHGFALLNRSELLPTSAELARAREAAKRAELRLQGRMELIYVTPDYYADRPRACMDGWARRYVHITPTGLVLPCHAAQNIKNLQFESVRERSLQAIWESSDALQRFRGEAWMPDPCRSCPERSRDHGGCRCQAFSISGDAGATDPACSLSPAHDLLSASRLTGPRREGDPQPSYQYRSPSPP
jgi:pyrroloquinoline quinone biosynthesis protein E